MGKGTAHVRPKAGTGLVFCEFRVHLGWRKPRRVLGVKLESSGEASGWAVKTSDFALSEVRSH